MPWHCLFVLPAWLKTWWNIFGRQSSLYLLAVRRKGCTIGIAPLRRTDDTVRFIGDKDVCDSLDFIVAPQKAAEFYRNLIHHFRQDGVKRLELEPVRRDSSVITQLLPIAQKAGCRISFEEDDVSFELDLPQTWEGWLDSLSGKERHEIRRKFRRLYAAGAVKYRLVDEMPAVKAEMKAFLALFRSNRPDKAEFMNDRMGLFFEDLAESLAEAHLLQLCFLDLDGKPIAATMCFNYHSAMYLYNNGYDKQFGSLSPGLLCKVLGIRESIQSGKTTYDFLKGDEPYKKRLGGRPIPIYRCVVEMS